MTTVHRTLAIDTPAAELRVAIDPVPTDEETAALAVALLATLKIPEEAPPLAESSPWRIVARREGVLGRREVDSGWGRPHAGRRR
ncbi:MAG: hypothetical protein IT337_14185 [Thermomicrobiales bacterium]|nr:hypothetical protein [Thermomicrobiales bacterium]